MVIFHSVGKNTTPNFYFNQCDGAKMKKCYYISIDYWSFFTCGLYYWDVSDRDHVITKMSVCVKCVLIPPGKTVGGVLVIWTRYPRFDFWFGHFFTQSEKLQFTGLHYQLIWLCQNNKM